MRKITKMPINGIKRMQEKVQENYLGDGLYFSFDGEQIKLRAPRDGGDHVVYIEQTTFSSLLRYIRKIGWI